jgi:hypothetical protein
MNLSAYGHIFPQDFNRDFQRFSNTFLCFDSCIFDVSFAILVVKILLFNVQPLLESTKEKLSQFCHVPVSFQ